MIILSAGALLYNEVGDFLIVNPTYKDMWEIPGGLIEENESPQQACSRELVEEIGLSPKIGKLLSVVHTSKEGARKESIQFIFDGGLISEKDITLRLEELSECKFISREMIDNYLAPSLGDRVRHALGNQNVSLNAYEEFNLISLEK